MPVSSERPCNLSPRPRPLPDIPFHALRHSFASLMLSGREHPKVDSTYCSCAI